MNFYHLSYHNMSIILEVFLFMTFSDESEKLRARPLAALEVAIFDPCCMHWEVSRGCFLFDVVPTTKMHKGYSLDTKLMHILTLK